LLDQLIRGDTVRIDFDPAKDIANRRKHGISLSFARQLDWDLALSWPDKRFSYSEERFAAIAPAGLKILFLGYSERGECRRMISLRKASRAEEAEYVRYHKDARWPRV
jgi:uncharacterized DUF497 family protein